MFYVINSLCKKRTRGQLAGELCRIADIETLLQQTFRIPNVVTFAMEISVCHFWKFTMTPFKSMILLEEMLQTFLKADVIFSATDMSQLTEINLLQSLHLHNTTFAGLQQKPGPHSPTPAAYFSGNLAVHDDIQSILILYRIITGSLL